MTYNLRIKFKDGDLEDINGLTQEEAGQSKKSFEEASHYSSSESHFYIGAANFWVVRANGEKFYFNTNEIKSVRVTKDARN